MNEQEKYEITRAINGLTTMANIAEGSDNSIALAMAKDCRLIADHLRKVL